MKNKNIPVSSVCCNACGASTDIPCAAVAVTRFCNHCGKELPRQTMRPLVQKLLKSEKKVSLINKIIFLMIVGLLFEFLITNWAWQTYGENESFNPLYLFGDIYFFSAIGCFILLTIAKYILRFKFTKRKITGLVIFLMSICLLGIFLFFLTEAVYDNEVNELVSNHIDDFTAFGIFSYDKIESFFIFSLFASALLVPLSQCLITKPKLTKAL